MAYTLYCFVLGEAAPFPVKIMKGQTVGELKEEIKKKMKKLASIDAHTLPLYKISVDVSDTSNYDSTIRELSQSHYVFNPKDKLFPLELISEHFRRPPKGKTIHLLVELPQSKLIDPRAYGAVSESISSQPPPTHPRRLPTTLRMLRRFHLPRRGTRL